MFTPKNKEILTHMKRISSIAIETSCAGFIDIRRILMDAVYAFGMEAARRLCNQKDIRNSPDRIIDGKTRVYHIGNIPHLDVVLNKDFIKMFCSEVKACILCYPFESMEDVENKIAIKVDIFQKYRWMETWVCMYERI